MFSREILPGRISLLPDSLLLPAPLLCFGTYPRSTEKHSTKGVLTGVMLPQICTIKPDCIHECFMGLLAVSDDR